MQDILSSIVMKSYGVKFSLAAFLIFMAALFGIFLQSTGGIRGVSHFSMWLNGHTVPPDFVTPKPPESAENIDKGWEIYKLRCARCHGSMGDGRGGRAEELAIKPNDFTSGIYKFRSTRGLLPTDDDIFKTVSGGLHGTAMLPWVGLETLEKWQVTYYIKTFSDIFEGEKPEAIKIPSPEKLEKPEKFYIELGKKTYIKAKCAECHGEGFKGDGSKADKLKDDRGNPIRPADYTRVTPKRGTDLGETFLTIATGLNGTPMEGRLETLNEEEILALAFYVRSLSKKPLGKGIIKGIFEMRPEEKVGIFIDHDVMMPTKFRAGYLSWMFRGGN